MTRVRVPPCLSRPLEPRADLSDTVQKRDDEHKLALKKTKAKDKRGAMMSLKKKKLYDTELAQLGQTRFSLEQQMQVLQQSVMQAETVKIMKATRDVQAAQIKAIGGADGVEDTMDEVRETMEEQQEIGEVLSMGFTGDVDVMEDQDLLGELEDLEEDLMDEQLAELAPVPTGGGVQVAAPPAAAPAAAAADGDAEMEAMMQAMMMPA